MLKLVVLSLVLSAVIADPDGYLSVETDNGDLLGAFHINSNINVSYFAFKGIPFAQPPIGDLRFRAPQPPLPWTGLRDATEHRATCIAAPQELPTEDEDCLFLNVYTTDVTVKKPVMFSIHGGAFTSGSGNSALYGPGYFLLEDIVVVTINYRLGALGFLSTGDSNAQGNAGLKDQVMALRWVQRNIEKFGGDPDNVSIVGQSAGGASVHYLITSPLAEGLFAKAILQSGVMLCPWAFQSDPLTQAKALGDSLNITYTTNEELIAGLRNADPADIRENSIASLIGAIPFVPSVERPDFVEEVLVSQTPFNILSTGLWKKLPILIGFTDAESLPFVAPGVIGQIELDGINEHGYLLIPDQWNIERESAAEASIVQTFRDTYFDGQDATMETRYNLTRFFTDQQYSFPVDFTARLHSMQQAEDVYYYTFSMDGSLNFLKILMDIVEYPGAAHADDLFYMWDFSEMFNIELPAGDPAILVRERMVRLFANFAKYSNPTPIIDDLIDSIWLPIDGNQEFVELNEEITPGTHTFGSRIAVWQNLFETYAFPLGK